MQIILQHATTTVSAGSTAQIDLQIPYDCILDACEIGMPNKTDGYGAVRVLVSRGGITQSYLGDWIPLSQANNYRISKIFGLHLAKGDEIIIQYYSDDAQLCNASINLVR